MTFIRNISRSKMIPFGLILYLALLASLIYTLSSTEAKSDNQAAIYVALGDSITLGYEPHVLAPWYGFADRLYEQLLYRSRAEYVNYGVFHLTSAELMIMVEAAAEGRELSLVEWHPNDSRAAELAVKIPEIGEALRKASLITVTIGGNDLLPLILQVAEGITQAALRSTYDELLLEVRGNIAAIAVQLREMNPDARILFTDQYQPVPDVLDFRVWYPLLDAFREEWTAALQDELTALNDPLLELVEIAESMTGQEWLYAHILRMDIHPTQRGYQLYAEKISEALWTEGYRQPLARIPLALIVGGNELDSPFPPLLFNDRTYLTLREATEALGARVEWDHETKTATVSYDNRVVAMTVGQLTISLNGELQPITSPPLLLESNGEMKTYVPMRLLAEGLGFSVTYLERTRSAYIHP